MVKRDIVDSDAFPDFNEQVMAALARMDPTAGQKYVAKLERLAQHYANHFASFAQAEDARLQEVVRTYVQGLPHGIGVRQSDLVSALQMPRAIVQRALRNPVDGVAKLGDDAYSIYFRPAAIAIDQWKSLPHPRRVQECARLEAEIEGVKRWRRSHELTYAERSLIDDVLKPMQQFVQQGMESAVRSALEGDFHYLGRSERAHGQWTLEKRYATTEERAEYLADIAKDGKSVHWREQPVQRAATLVEACGARGIGLSRRERAEEERIVWDAVLFAAQSYWSDLARRVARSACDTATDRLLYGTDTPVDAWPSYTCLLSERAPAAERGWVGLEKDETGIIPSAHAYTDKRVRLDLAPIKRDVLEQFEWPSVVHGDWRHFYLP